MFLHIADTMTIGEIQERFTECFPLLKIEFYSKSHKRFEETDNRFRLHSSSRIEDIRTNHVNGVMEIKSWHTVTKVEKQLKDLFGLNVQIFRGCPGGAFIQTSLSDDLTLQEQGQLGLGVNQGSKPV